MIDWKELDSLKIHRTIMTFVVLGLLAVLILMPRHFLKTRVSLLQGFNTTKVTAKSGLKIRIKPNVNSKVLIVVPCNETLKIEAKYFKIDFVRGHSGSWYRVEYKDIKGYAWSKYLE